VVGVDRLSTLIPELIGVIYDNFASDADRHFLPIVRSLLYSQRINLYRRVHLADILTLAKFCRTLAGNSGIELGGMVIELTIDQLTERKYLAEPDDEGLDHAQEIMIENKVQLILPQLTRLNILRVETPSAARPIIPFFSSPTSVSGASTIVILRLQLENYDQVRLILPHFPNLLELSLSLPTYTSMLELESAAPEAPYDSTLQPRHLNRLFIQSNFTVQSVCQIVASTEAKVTSLFGVAIHNVLRVLRNSEKMESLVLCCNDGDEASQDHGRALVKFNKVKKLNLNWGIRVKRTFFTDLFRSNPGLESLRLGHRFAIVASDLISAIRTNPIAGLRLDLSFVGLEGDYADEDDEDEDEDEDDLDDVDWPDGCQPLDVRSIMACGALAGIEVTGSAVDIVNRLQERDLLHESHDSSEEDEEGEDEEDEEEEAEAEED
jgi:hypothetical protein